MSYLQDASLDKTTINNWIKQFHEDGFLVIPSVLRPDTCETLRNDLDEVIYERRDSSRFAHRMFETSKANLELFWMDPIASFAENLIEDNGSVSTTKYYEGIPNANQTHVIHNNSFIIRAGKNGLGLSGWHTDDTPHMLSLDGEPITNVRMNVLAFTCLYYLTDVPTVAHGPTQMIKGSHLFGKYCKGDITGYEDKVVSATGPAGTVVMLNNQTWHRGSPNDSTVDRYCTQISYAKRLVGHKYGTFMNYEMPEHVYKDINDSRKLRLLGFLGHGAYG